MKGKGTALVVVLVLALLFGGSALAKGDDTPDKPDEPPDDDVPDEPPPPPPDPKKHNYVGSVGYNWPHKDQFPNELSFGLRLQQLGYATNPASGTWSPISADTMTVVRAFQRDFNAVRKVQVFTPVAQTKSLDPDGLIGNNTIAALLLATQWQLESGSPWQTFVGNTA